MKKSKNNFFITLMIVALLATTIIEMAAMFFGFVAVFSFAVGSVLVAGVTLACYQIITFNKTQNHGKVHQRNINR
jgi:hypothetical protein